MSLTNIQLSNLCAHYNLPLRGIFMRDQTEGLQPQMGFYIFNLQPASCQMNGSHWVCAIITEHETLYFDSFGGTPPPDIKAFLQKYQRGRPIATNAWIIQDIDSSRCGFYCIAFAIWVLHKSKLPSFTDRMDDFVNHFVDDTKKNGAILLSLFKTTFGKPHQLIHYLAKHN